MCQGDGVTLLERQLMLFFNILNFTNWVTDSKKMQNQAAPPVAERSD
jgi:hypothetical protein